jgi:hypothetical protein
VLLHNGGPPERPGKPEACSGKKTGDVPDPVLESVSNECGLISSQRKATNKQKYKAETNFKVEESKELCPMNRLRS